MRGVIQVTLLAVAVVTSAAQARQTTTPARPLVDGLANLYSGVEENVTAAAELVPESLYSFRPTADVRTFGQIVTHIADAQRAICAAMNGGNVNLTDEYERTATTKAAAVNVLRSTFETCRQRLASLTDQSAQALVPFGEQPAAVATLATFVISHGNEHYGNLVTYMRLNGIVPPSSRVTR